ncbi:MAG: hypothetical protein LBR67_06060 [Dysgonamonadaceae bacterium]|nr:hypothetical protein [Dysgonamonadaceae bacterium]
MKIRKFLRAIFLLAAAMAISTAAFAETPRPVADDVITVSGGSVSPDNPDVYVIEMGDFVCNQVYSINVERPKGYQANYPVSIEYALLTNDYGMFWNMVDNGIMHEGNETGLLTFAPGETTKTVQFKASPYLLEASCACMFLFFGEGSRTKAEFEVVKMNFTNSASYTPATTMYAGGAFAVFTEMPKPLHVGHYMLIRDPGGWGQKKVLNNTRLHVQQKTINHENYATNISVYANATTRTVQLKPEQPVGAITSYLNFLLKATEDAVITNFPLNGGEAQPCFVRQTTQITNLEMWDGTNYGTFPVSDADYGDAIPLIDWNPYVIVTPRFGTITADASSYDAGATVMLTIPVLNCRLLQKIHSGNSWMDDIDITLDGGDSFVDRGNMSFDGANIIAYAEAINETSAPIEVTAEIRCRKVVEDPGLWAGDGMGGGASHASLNTIVTALIPPLR